VDEHNHAKMQESLDYIHKNFIENITLEDMAKLLHMSESRFRHLFKETIQIGFKEYITYLRLSESRKLLLTTDMNVSDIANSSGYTNIHQFYKVFYQYVFMSPAEYRSLYKPKHSETAHSHN
jgi:YesN/AraC family two-component response regulator